MAHQIWVILFKSVIMPLTDLISWKTVNNVKNILQNQTIETLISGKPDDHTDMNKYSFCVCQALTCSALKSLLLRPLPAPGSTPHFLPRPLKLSFLTCFIVSLTAFSFCNQRVTFLKLFFHVRCLLDVLNIPEEDPLKEHRSFKLLILSSLGHGM